MPTTVISEGASSDAAQARPKLAVVISCFNYEAFVTNAIESVRSQANPDCELVVVDDGSTDGSWAVIQGTGVKAYRTENGGQVAACLYGLDRTSAPFVLFLDADDELKPGAIAAILQHLDSDVAKLQFAMSVIDETGGLAGEDRPKLLNFRVREPLAQRVLRTGVYKSPPTSGNVFRRDLCELAREASYDQAIDGIMLFAAPFFGDVVSLSEALGRYRVHRRNHSGLGRAPDKALFGRDMGRYLARMKHLREVLQRRDDKRKLVDPTKTFYFRELNFSLAIASGKRPPLTSVPGLIATFSKEDASLKRKASLSLYYVIAALMPPRLANNMLAYRHGAGSRSGLGFLKSMFSRPGA